MMWSPAADGAERAAASLPAEDRSRQALARWIDALAFAESGNRSWIIHQDRDGRNYYGCLQFREETFRYFATKFHLVETDEPEEFMTFIYDCRLQKRLASRMIRDNPANWKHWRKTVERIGLPPGAKAPADAVAVAGQSSHAVK
jgi:hypothetical protein